MIEFTPTVASQHAVPPNSSSYWVVSGLLLAGAYPGHPDPEKHRAKIESLVSAGIRAFVNLMEPDETNLAGQPFTPYADVARQLCPEVVCVRRPIRDVSVPTKAGMSEILDEIDHYLNARMPAFIHCWGGVGRTGTVVGCWLLRHRLAKSSDVLDVLTRLRQQDRERGYKMSPETEEQQKFVRQWRDS
jgi:protein-tyrosine phosphatase